MSSLIVIPSRWGSTRFPGKPLALLRGKTLLHRVIEAAEAAARDRPGTRVVVATDDDRIARHAGEVGCPAVMTDSSIDNGTARALAAARAIDNPPRTILNLQGDTPFVSLPILAAILGALGTGVGVATPVVRLGWPELDSLRAHKVASPFSGTTCVGDAAGRALWFSKQVIPAIRDEARQRATEPLSPVLRHIGLYGYTLEALERFAACPPTRNEELEGLEQLRFLELGIPVQLVVVPPPPISTSGIDTPADLDRAALLIDEHGEPDWT